MDLGVKCLKFVCRRKDNKLHYLEFIEINEFEGVFFFICMYI